MSRCRYCYQEGHNQRTCPKKTAAMKKRHDHDIAEGRTDSYWVKEYQKRVAPKGAKGKKVSNQQCGYCQDYGHTRRKCLALQNDKVFYAKHHNNMVQIAYDYLVTSPVGIGSLFTQNREIWKNSAYVNERRMLVAIDFGIATNLLGIQPRPFLVLQDVATGQLTHKSLWKFVNGRKDDSYSRKVKLIAQEAQPVSSNWVSQHSTNVDKLKTHELFKRTGRKHEDVRNYVLSSLARDRSLAYGDFGFSRAQDDLAQWEPDYIRAKMLKDFA